MFDLNRQVVISIKTILYTLGLLVALYVAYALRGIFGLVFVSILVTIAMESAVKRIMCLNFMNKPLSRSFAVISAYLALLVVVVAFFVTAVPMVVREAQRLFSTLSFYFSDLNLEDRTVLETFSSLDALTGAIQPGNLSAFLSGSISVVSRIVTALVLSIYMSLDWPNLKDKFVRLFPSKKEKSLRELLYSIEVEVGTWIKGQLTVMFVVGSLGFVSLGLIGVNYALALGFISGLLEIVPILGPFFATVVATGIAFSQSYTKGIITFLAFLAIQQFEGNILTPKVMEKFSGLSPLIILLGILVGHEFFGIAGAILAIPVMMIMAVFYKRRDLLSSKS